MLIFFLSLFYAVRFNLVVQCRFSVLSIPIVLSVRFSMFTVFVVAVTDYEFFFQQIHDAEVYELEMR